MGCNCKKEGIPLSLKQKLRRETKENIADVKRLWQESSSDNKIISNKEELGFKPKK